MEVSHGMDKHKDPYVLLTIAIQLIHKALAERNELNRLNDTLDNCICGIVFNVAQECDCHYDFEDNCQKIFFWPKSMGENRPNFDSLN